jgi:hypothetical protein
VGYAPSCDMQGTFPNLTGPRRGLE